MSEMNLSLKQISQWLSGAQLVGDAALTVQRINTDSRTCQAGDLFVALKGERFDANDFLPQVATSGATAALATHGLTEAKLAGVQVSDTRIALGQLAKGWRSQFKLPIIAVTGSNGKTTVTQMIASILRAGFGDDALATQGNLNNDIGVPQTLLRMRAHHRSAVVELGMNHPGEIAGLADMTQATVALVNNAQREHQEHMNSVDAVAQENGQVILALPANGVAVFPADDTYTAQWQAMAGARATLCFSLAPHSSAPVRLQSAAWQQDHWAVVAHTPAGDLHVQLHIAGRHNIGNALAATACALAAGVSLDVIAQGLSQFEPVKGRSRALSVTCQGRTITVVDDTYNANPDSVRAAIDVLADLPAPRLLVLGDMGEVGQQGPEFHQEVGAYAKAQGIDHVLCLGDLAVHTAQAVGAAAQHMADIDTLNAEMTKLLPHMGSVLVKGSRFMKMERVIDAILQCDSSKKEAAPCC
ncbi:UDP-N-acetylmuramoyl-tripeptide--D-alanyl-D-alanine ligase [Limnohabitans sp. MORI2]|uniref:UDP-N-acetylmuramoyl-tripeptide--D-alanyl-D- alanine ligase n=1 Tax=Limnohabitans sp. MORI2 TaxID=1751150 RepID=UPI002376EA75|nr:UDP-N-acetylmuramoyl-tripeptide--D-alanyl-D-alanine ligase [Limnohabitans sp. MORI2]BDU57450.1 UDP-N-acetylmuramoyl-tripeptide--D-alanyl-D-alanine ligase [Limnohabitans sp. MORI2]